MVSQRVTACPSAHLHFCHFPFLHVGASDWHCLHPVQHSWLNDHLVNLSFNMTFCDGTLLSHTRWLPGFARVPHYAPSVNILYTQDTYLEVSFPFSFAPSFPRAIPPPLASSLPPPMPRPVPSSIVPIINPPSLNPPFLH